MASGNVQASNTSGSAKNEAYQNISAVGNTTTTKTFRDQQLGVLDAAEVNALDYGNVMKSVNAVGAATTTNALQTSMPGIEAKGKTAGGYNDTTANMLIEHAAAEASAQGAIAAGQNYAAIMGANASAVTAASGAVAATQTGTSTNVTGRSNSNSASNTYNDSTQVGGGASVGTVICTQLYRDGLLSEEVYLADNLYVREHISPAAVNGYRFWAVPFVYAMRKYPLVYAIGKYFGLKWSYHCASHYLPNVKPNLIGKLMLALGVPIVFCLGSVIPDVEYYKLWKGS
jgi:hypothetical protein